MKLKDNIYSTTRTRSIAGRWGGGGGVGGRWSRWREVGEILDGGRLLEQLTFLGASTEGISSSMDSLNRQ